MTTERWLIGFYAVSAMAIIALLARYFARRRRERRELEQIQARQLHATSRPAEEVDMPAAVVPDSHGGQAVSSVARSANEFASASGDWDRRVAGVPKISESEYAFGSLTPALAALLPESENRRRETRKELIQAGYYQPSAYENLAATRYLGIMMSLLVFGAALVLAPRAWEPSILTLLIIAPFFAWAAPRLYVKSKSRERRTRIEHAMPDLLDMLNMCVSQGLTVAQSLKRIHRDLQSVYPDLAQEVRIVCEQAEIGSLPQAIDNLRQRLDVPEVHSFATLILQTERMGTSVSEALTEYSDNMRESLRQRTDEKANNASFKLMFPTVLCLMPAVLMFLLGPAVIELSKFFESDYSNALNRQTQMIQELRIDRQRP